ncbi:NAD-dependent epimerase/dehydratase family protein [Staphylococcus gallinarum]|uniref:polysaccharide biosynthesis C-terminal domain-containing protein n=1 Tax=Staphylococcus gallinarum TaxID=1293 RepID=UPI001E4DF186|nr:NAD-dependent epimerase/dehydratase family protein [Staphylococcus gallinarum]MCD8909788.1 NAD-dependent epimerase/dehydratase family protein [Staphylococcus gallinarum]
MKNIVITGASGFVGKNLVWDLSTDDSINILEINRNTDENTKQEYLKTGDIIIHLAGVNRPKNPDEFYKGNVNFLEEMLETIKSNEKKPPILFSSSIQVTKSNEYGDSKYQAEEKLKKFSKENGNEIYIYRLPNLFGKWCKPNYNSVIATFCHNIARNKEITINDSRTILKLNYIDDVIQEFKNVIFNQVKSKEETYFVPNVYEKSLGEIVDLLKSFKETRNNRTLPKLDNDFEKKLYSTYLSYIPKDEFNYPLKMNIDERGSFTEFIKTPDRGQVSVNISKPGITKGNHWHHTKNEKFLVVSGKGVIRFRLPFDSEIIEYFVSGEKLEVIDIPVGYTHNIENLGDKDMVTIMWVNEMFNPDVPDTYFLEVNNE